MVEVEEIIHSVKQTRNQHMPNVLLLLMNFVLNRNGQSHVGSKYIGITFFQEHSRNTGKVQYTYCSLILHLKVFILEHDQYKINEPSQCLAEK